jgi:hypothetical protein
MSIIWGCQERPIASVSAALLRYELIRLNRRVRKER